MNEDTKILTAEEIDALYRAAGSGSRASMDPTPSQGGSGIGSVGTTPTMRRASNISVDVILQEFGRGFREVLLDYLQKSVEVNPSAVVPRLHQDFTRLLPAYSSIHIMQVKPLKKHMVIGLDRDFIFSIVDIVLGGSGAAPSQDESRGFSSVEKKIIERLVEMARVQLARAWSHLLPVEVRRIRSETNPRFIQVGEPSETVLYSSIEIGLKNSVARIHFGIPDSALEGLPNSFAGGMNSNEHDPAWSDDLSHSLSRVPVELAVPLNRRTVTIYDILKLNVGDTVPLDWPQRVTAEVDGIPVFECEYGRDHNHHTLKIESLLNPQYPNYFSREKKRRDPT